MQNPNSLAWILVVKYSTDYAFHAIPPSIPNLMFNFNSPDWDPNNPRKSIVRTWVEMIFEEMENQEALDYIGGMPDIIHLYWQQFSDSDKLTEVEDMMEAKHEFTYGEVCTLYKAMTQFQVVEIMRQDLLREYFAVYSKNIDHTQVEKENTKPIPTTKLGSNIMDLILSASGAMYWNRDDWADPRINKLNPKIYQLWADFAKAAYALELELMTNEYAKSKLDQVQVD